MSKPNEEESLIEEYDEECVLEDDLLIEKPKKGRKPLPKSNPEEPVKPKRPMSEKQMENIYKAIAKRKELAEQRKAVKADEELLKNIQKEELILEKKKEIERKIIKKAVVLKKREVLEQTALDEISDDEIPDKVIQKIIKKQQAKKVKVVKLPQPEPEPEEVIKPKYTFV